MLTLTSRQLGWLDAIVDSAFFNVSKASYPNKKDHVRNNWIVRIEVSDSENILQKLAQILGIPRNHNCHNSQVIYANKLREILPQLVLKDKWRQQEIILEVLDILKTRAVPYSRTQKNDDRLDELRKALKLLHTRKP